MRLLDLKGVGFGYPGQAPILSGVNFSVNQGDRILILGSNGSGKSTLALLMAGVLTPVTGELFYRGNNYSTRLESAPEIGLVFQNSNDQMVGTTVEEDLAFGLIVRNLPPAKITDKVQQYLKLFGLEAKKNCSAAQLSGGELRRLALASVMITEPEILILDEPLAMLDYRNQTGFLEILQELVPKKTAVIWLDHTLKSVRYMEDWYLMKKGQGLVRLSLADLNDRELVLANKLNPAPLQFLEWKSPQRFSQSIFGPEKIIFNED